MSMISGLIDELNKSADEWNASNMFELARMCRDAADTIWQLRDDLQRANAENAKLRELVDGWDFCSKTKSSTFDNCVGCPLFIQTLHSYRCARDERMRELGIEV